jgi:exodeoxyribonuclease V beta subunit
MHASQNPDDLSAARLQHMLTDVLNTPLQGFNGQSLALAQVSRRDRLTELEFSLPVLRLSADDLWAICQRHQVPVPRLAFKDLAGYLRGFIDLVFRVQSGDESVYYLLDWKSNYLGDHPDDYRVEVLQAAMLSHGYFLQALIYSVALHRHLRLNLANYDPERHLGGAFYLFVRGVRPDWPNAGVVHWRPSLALLDELENAFHDTGNRDGE